MQVMKKCGEDPPYYCHYMSWRLGTWEDESPLERLDGLLDRAEQIPNWRKEKGPWIGSADFGVFWSLFWQLQVAEHLTRVGTEVCWGKSNQNDPSPDLSVVVNGQRWFVECYVPQKSLGLLGFLNEVLQKIDERSGRGREEPVFVVLLSASYDRCLPFKLPTGLGRKAFLDDALRCFLDPNFLATARRAASISYPVCVYKHSESSLRVYLEGDDIGAYRPGIRRDRTGSPRGYVECVLKEAVDAKMSSNGLRTHRPNVLAVNYLIGDDFQLARGLRGPSVVSEMRPELGPNIDVLAVSAVGIDQELSREQMHAEVKAGRSWSLSLGEIACGPSICTAGEAGG